VKTADFDYELPPERIAQRPLERGRSRLLVLDRSTGKIEHQAFPRLGEHLVPGDLLLLNDTRVIPARLEARRGTGRRFELLLLRPAEEGCWQALLRPGARARPGEELLLADGGAVVPRRRLDDGQWLVGFSPPLDSARLERLGGTPLPPYIRRPHGPTAADREDYQTVYASEAGAAAAPTAGLHFTREILGELAAEGIELVFLTLHVGLGTFRPVAVEDVAEHRMHREWYRFAPEAAAAVNGARGEGRRVVCVGTTSVRALEAALRAGEGRVEPGDGWTDLFITPGFSFAGTGAMLTNFHLPRSTLLMLVCAFAGRERVLAAYGEAVRRGYRFYSYGDAMLIL